MGVDLKADFLVESIGYDDSFCVDFEQERAILANSRFSSLGTW